MNPLRPTARFIAAVHRRMLLMQLLEKTGLSLLAASILSLILMPIAIWQSTPTLPILISAGATGLLSGAVLTAYRRPTRQAVAAEADRQLRLDDLLFTAMSTGESTEDFAIAMRAMADAQCARHSPSEVMFRRLGVRSWGAIGLAMSAAVTLAVIPFGASRSQAVDANASVLADDFSDAHLHDGATTADAEDIHSNNPISEGASNTAAPGDQSPMQATNQGANLAPDKAPDKAPDRASSPGLNTRIGNDSAAGNSTTNAKPSVDSQASVLNPKKPIDNGTTSGGGTASANATSAHDASHGTEKSGGTDATPAWRGDAASDHQTGPNTPVNINSVPPQQRDLVRDFFSGQ
jgi:hypothetical protein